MEEININDAMKEATGRELLGDLLNDIETAKHLFSEKKTRFVYSADAEQRPCFRIILNEELCLWWFKYENGWKYDGHEIGRYMSNDGEQCWSNKNL